MSTAIYLLLAAAFVVAVFAVLLVIVKTVTRFQGKMLVTCPETHEPVGVEVNVKHAALTAIVGEQSLKLKSCTPLVRAPELWTGVFASDRIGSGELFGANDCRRVVQGQNLCAMRPRIWRNSLARSQAGADAYV